MWRRWMRSQARISPRGSLRSPPSSLNSKVTMTVIRLEIPLRMTLTWNVTSVVLCAWLFFSFFLCNFDYLQLLLCFLNIVILVCWKFEKFSELHDTCICYLTISSEVNNARSEYNTKKRKCGILKIEINVLTQFWHSISSCFIIVNITNIFLILLRPL